MSSVGCPGMRCVLHWKTRQEKVLGKILAKGMHCNCLQHPVADVFKSDFSHWLLQNFHCRPPALRSRLIFTIQERGGFDSKFSVHKLVDLKMSKFFTSYVNWRSSLDGCHEMLLLQTKIYDFCWQVERKMFQPYSWKIESISVPQETECESSKHSNHFFFSFSFYLKVLHIGASSLLYNV